MAMPALKISLIGFHKSLKTLGKQIEEMFKSTIMQINTEIKPVKVRAYAKPFPVLYQRGARKKRRHKMIERARLLMERW